MVSMDEIRKQAAAEAAVDDERRKEASSKYPKFLNMSVIKPGEEFFFRLNKRRDNTVEQDEEEKAKKPFLYDVSTADGAEYTLPTHPSLYRIMEREANEIAEGEVFYLQFIGKEAIPNTKPVRMFNKWVGSKLTKEQAATLFVPTGSKKFEEFATKKAKKN